jgi:hypothetical protein
LALATIPTKEAEADGPNDSVRKKRHKKEGGTLLSGLAASLGDDRRGQ